MATVGSLKASLTLNSTGFTAGLNQATQRVGTFARDMQNQTVNMGGMFSKVSGQLRNLTMIGGGAAIVSEMRKAAQFASDLTDRFSEGIDAAAYFGTVTERGASAAHKVNNAVGGIAKAFDLALNPTAEKFMDRIFPSIAKQAKDFAEINKIMDTTRDKLFALGKSEQELGVHQLNRLNATKKTIDQYREWSQEMERQKKVMADQGAADNLIKKLQEQIETFGMTSAAIENHKVQTSRASVESKKRAAALTREVELLEEKAKMEEAAARAAEDAARTRAEAEKRKLDTVSGIFDKMRLFTEELRAPQRPQGGAFNSPEAQRRIVEIERGAAGRSFLEKLTQDEITELRRHSGLLQRIEQAIKNGETAEQVEIGTANF